MNVARLPLEILRQCCAEETERFTRRQHSTPQFCFELWRRALAQSSPDAFAYVYTIYEPLVRRWVYGHSRFAQTDEPADYFVSIAFTNFYFAVQGSKFDQFSELPKLLAYLKLCVHTAILQHLRDRRRLQHASLHEAWEIGHTPQLDAEVNVHELWSHVCRLLPEHQDQLLAHCVFVQHLKPAQIKALYNGRWESARQVSVALQRIRRILRADAKLRQWTDVGEPSFPIG